MTMRRVFSCACRARRPAGALLLALAVAVGGGCRVTGATMVPPATPDGVLGLDFNDLNAAAGFSANLALAQAAGVQAATLHLDWNQLEPCTSMANCAPNYVDYNGALAAAEAVYGSTPMRLSLTLAPVDTSSIPLPADLTGTPFYDFSAATGDPSGTACTGSQPMVQRFDALIDYVLTAIPDVRLTSLQIGNEIDLNTAFAAGNLWDAYAAFFRCVRTHAKATYAALHNGADLPVGVTFSLYGLIDPAQSASLVAYNVSLQADEVGVTYYPIDSRYHVKNPSVVAADVDALAALYPQLPIFFQEVGYPTSAQLGSSDALQAQFVQAMFQAWDRHRAQIPFLAFLRLNDTAPAGSTDFDAYLATLGLRTYAGTGTDKPAYCTLKTEAAARGWSTALGPCP